MTPADPRERLGPPPMAMQPARTPPHGAKEAREGMADKAHDSREKRREAWEKRRRKRRLAWVFFALGAVVGVSHLLEHLDVIQVLPNPTAQDLLLGYPTAGLLIVIGLIMLPAEKF